jgi:type II secretory pathway component GspD/PulD (secretin)
MRSVKGQWAVVLGGVVSLLAATALIAADKDKPPAGKDGKPEAKPLKTSVYRLKHSDPEEVRQVLESLLEVPEVPDVPLPPGGPGAVGGGGVGGNFGIVGGGGGALGAVGGFGGMGVLPRWRLAVDARTQALIVRGAEEDLRIASDLVAVLDQPAGKAPPAVKSLRAFPLAHADADELAQVLGELNLPARTVPVSTKKLLIATGPEEALKEVGEVIKELDVAVKSEDPKPEDTKPKEKKPQDKKPPQ